MGHFDELLDRARSAVRRAVSEIGDEIFDPGFEIADITLEVMEDLVPEDVDVAWCTAMLSEHPGLLEKPADGDTVVEVLRSAVIELALSSLDVEMEEHAASLGVQAAAVPIP